MTSPITIPSQEWFTANGTSAVKRKQADKLGDLVSIADFLPVGFVTDGSVDYATQIQAALNSGAKVVTGSGLTYKANVPLTVPANVALVDAVIQIGVSHTTALLMSSNSKALRVKVIGTGVTDSQEIGFYPATDGASDVDLDVEVTNINVGVNVLPLVSTRPMRWRGRIYAHEIVGAAGVSLGYALLLSPADNCKFEVIGKNIFRHAAYLSAGAQRNDIYVDADTVGNWAVQMYSTQAQPTTQYNTIRGTTKNHFVPSGQAAGQSGGVICFDNCSHNRITVTVDVTAGSTYGAGVAGADMGIVIEGNQGAGQVQPTGNMVIGSKIVGGSIAAYAAAYDANGEQSIWADNDFRAYGTVGNFVLALRKLGTPTLTTGPSVYGNNFTPGASLAYFVWNEVLVPTLIGPNQFVGTFTTNTIGDATGGKMAVVFPASAKAATYGATVAIPSATASIFTITATNNTAFTISNPTSTGPGQLLTIRIKNTSGGALGVVTWSGQYKLGAAWASPATGFNRSITFYYDTTDGVWLEVSRATADVTN